MHLSHERRMLARDIYAQRILTGLLTQDPLALRLCFAHPASRRYVAKGRAVPWDVIIQVAGSRMDAVERNVLAKLPNDPGTSRIDAHLSATKRVISDRVYDGDGPPVERANNERD